MAAPRATIPDLVVLAFLKEKPSHGYALIAELERCEVEDWAGVSRAQVYYSLRKLEQNGWTTPVASVGRAKSSPDGSTHSAPQASGPDRTTYRLTYAGRCLLRQQLALKEWAQSRPAPPFLTWMALSPHATPSARRKVIQARHDFLSAEIAKEDATFIGIRNDTQTPRERLRLAEAMVSFTLQQFRAELRFLEGNLELGGRG